MEQGRAARSCRVQLRSAIEVCPLAEPAAAGAPSRPRWARSAMAMARSCSGPIGQAGGRLGCATRAYGFRIRLGQAARSPGLGQMTRTSDRDHRLRQAARTSDQRHAGELYLPGQTPPRRIGYPGRAGALRLRPGPGRTPAVLGRVPETEARLGANHQLESRVSESPESSESGGADRAWARANRCDGCSAGRP